MLSNKQNQSQRTEYLSHILFTFQVPYCCGFMVGLNFTLLQHELSSLKSSNSSIFNSGVPISKNSFIGEMKEDKKH